MSVKTKAQALVERQAELNTRLAETLTEKGVEADGSETTTALIDKVKLIPQGGGDNYYDLFWDTYQENGERTDYSYVFKCLVDQKEGKYKLHDYWNEETFKPKYDIKPVNANYMFQNFSWGGSFDLEAHLKKCGVVLDMSNATNAQYTFNTGGFSIIPELNFSEAISTLSATFYSSQVRIIRKITSHTNLAYNNTFGNCQFLEEIRFEGVIGKSISFSSSDRLSAASLQSIVEVLADLTGQTSQILSLTSTSKSLLTDEQIATITGKNWTLA